MRPCVLHITQTTHAGVARCVLDLTKDQVARGWTVVVASPDTDQFPDQIGLLGAAHHPWASTREPGARTVAELRPLAELVRRVDPDVVHLHSSKAGLVGRLVIRGRRPTLFQPNGWSFHAAGAGLARRAAVRWEKAAGRWTSTLLCVSERERTDAAAAGIKAPVRVVPNAVDLRRFAAQGDDARRAVRQLLGLGDDPLVLCVARLVHQKGQDVLLAAWPQVLDRVPDARLALVGEGPDVEKLRRSAPPGVVFAGHRTDVPQWMAAADVVVLPSRWEGMSYVMLEAMASGRSVVATDVGGAREAIGEEAGRAAGALVAPENPSALARAVAERVSDPAMGAAEGAEGARRARARHSLDAWADVMAEITLDALGARTLST